MNALCVLIFMILCHIIADYSLQGWLASAKQLDWWKKQEGYNDFYKNDYKMALFMHSLEWSIMIHLPIIVFYNFQVTIGILISILGNCYLHYFQKKAFLFFIIKIVICVTNNSAKSCWALDVFTLD